LVHPGMSSIKIRVALAGNPNVGKTTLFNRLTGGNLKVGNWPGVTVEKVEGVTRYKGRKMEMVDLPGTYSLTAYSLDELIARNHIIEHTPDVIVQVADAGNLGRNLYLTYQLLELNCKLVIALNMWDMVNDLGLEIDVDALSAHLGVPVVPVVSTTGEGTKELLKVIVEESERGKTCGRSCRFDDDVEEAITRVEKVLQRVGELPFPDTRWTAIKVLEGDEQVIRQLEELGSGEALRAVTDGINHMDMEIAISDGRYREVDRILSKVRKRTRRIINTGDLIDSVVTHRYLGIPIFLVVMWSMFRLTFDLGRPFSDLIDIGFSELSTLVSENISPPWLASMLGEGVIGGVGAVLVFLPNILILFLLISILESSGYMARAAFVMDRVMSKISLSGKSFIPMVIGFGCNVPAIMATRTIDDRKDRLVTILISPFVSCGARLPVYVLLAGIFFKGSEGLVIFGLYILGIGVAILSAKLFRHTILKGEPSPFIMELPRYKGPDVRLSLRSTWEKGSQYLRKAGTIILFGSVIMWFLASFDITLKSVDYGSSSSMAGLMGKLIAPVLAPLGFDWRIAVALIFGFVAKEIVVSTMGVLYASEGGTSSLSERFAADSHLGTAGGLAMMVFVLLYVPCLATVGVMKQETGSWAWTLFSVFYSTGVAYLAALMIYQGGTLLGI